MAEPHANAETQDELMQRHRCGAKTRGGGTCKNWAPPGQKRCTRMHGGAARQVKQAAENRREEQRARALVRTFIGEGVVAEQADPIAELMRMQQVAVLTEQGYAQLLRDDFGDWKKGALVHRTLTGEEPRALVKLWNEERDRLAKLSAALISAGIAERQVRIAEMQARQVADALTKTLADLKLAPEIAESARQRFAGYLRGAA